MAKRAALATIAAVDLGSNSFHLVIARAEGSGLRMVDRLRERVQLGAGLDRHDRLTRSAQQRALACLARFRERLKGIPASDVRAVATQTLRRAINAAEFLAAAQRVLGAPVDVIAGREEARLIYLGVAHSLPRDERRRLVVDIGGGSTELIIGERFAAVETESLDMGCVAYARRFFSDGAIRATTLQAARVAAGLELEPIRARFLHAGWLSALGTSGTIRAVEQVLRAAHWSERGISAPALQRLNETLLAAGHAEHLMLPGLNPDRRGVFAPGVAILQAVFDALAIEHLEVADGALREGVLYDLLDRRADHDTRALTIEALLTRYQTDIAHARRVAATAARLFAAAAKPWKLDRSHEPRLIWAAQLHEIGLIIAHAQYHKHGAYLIQHADMPGFGAQEQTLLATLIRGHRRKFPRPVFAALPAAERSPMERLCVLLRLAVLLHRGRSSAPLPRMRLKFTARGLRLSFTRGWLARHALIAADLAQEARWLKEIGFKLSVGQAERRV